MGSARRGSNPLGVETCKLPHLGIEPKTSNEDIMHLTGGLCKPHRRCTQQDSILVSHRQCLMSCSSYRTPPDHSHNSQHQPALITHPPQNTTNINYSGLGNYGTCRNHMAGAALSGTASGRFTRAVPTCSGGGGGGGGPVRRPSASIGPFVCSSIPRV